MSPVVFGTPHPAENERRQLCCSRDRNQTCVPTLLPGRSRAIGGKKKLVCRIPSCPAPIHQFELQRFPHCVECLLSYRGISDPGVVKVGSRPETRQRPGWEDPAMGGSPSMEPQRQPSQVPIGMYRDH